MSSPTSEHYPLTQTSTVMVIDTETTGLDHKTEELIEVAAAKLVDGDVVATYTSLVKPTVPVRRSSFNVHHISEEMLEEARPIEDVLPEFLDFMGDLPFVAHNAIFDFSFINEAHKKIHNSRWRNAWIDTLDMYRCVFPEEASHGLSALLERFDFPSHVSHRALDDAENLARVYPLLNELYQQKQAYQLEQIKNIPYLLERYHRMQKAIQGMQSEMGDLRDIFKFHFQQGGEPVKTTTGELMVSNQRRYYEYNDRNVWEILHGAGLVEKGAKLNTRALDKLIRSSSTDDDIRSQLKDSRVMMHTNQSVQFIKQPDEQPEEKVEAQPAKTVDTQPAPEALKTPPAISPTEAQPTATE